MPSRLLSASLWIGQVVLAAIFATAASIKTSVPLDELAQRLVWTADVPGVVVRLLGVIEGIGALGIFLPSLVRIRPELTPAAGAGLTLLMICAGIFHLVRGEIGTLPGILVLGLLAASVAWGRHRQAPIRPRSADPDDD